MLISFSVENFLSFKEKTTISAVAGRQRTHRERLPLLKKYGIHVLPIAAIYGGNASGKSNLFEAFSFVKDFVSKGQQLTEKIPVAPFLLCAESKRQPTKFWIEFYAGESLEYMYELYFAVTQEEVLEEKLTIIKSSSERVLYERSAEKGFIINSNSDGSHLNFISKSTRGNQLFITNTVDNNNDTYRDVYNWFASGMKLISTAARFIGYGELLDRNNTSYDEINSLVNVLDTGILRLDTETAENIDSKLSENMLKDEGFFHRVSDRLRERFIEPEGDEKTIRRIVAFHKCDDDSETKFPMALESEGTRRLIELLPAFIPYDEDECGVFIIDEFDRSLHHLLLRRLLEIYLSRCNKNTRLQLIFTTHDLLLMDQELLRRDEMFVIERDDSGVSSIIPLDEYKGVRSDKVILKSYIQGRFGGVPRL